MRKLLRRTGAGVGAAPPPISPIPLVPELLQCSWWFDYVLGTRVQLAPVNGSATQIASVESLFGVAGSGPNGLAQLVQPNGSDGLNLLTKTFNPGGDPFDAQCAVGNGSDKHLIGTDPAHIAVGNTGVYEMWSAWQMPDVLTPQHITGFNGTADDVTFSALRLDGDEVQAEESTVAEDWDAQVSPAVINRTYVSRAFFDGGQHRNVDVLPDLGDDGAASNMTPPVVSNYVHGSREGLTGGDYMTGNLLSDVGFNRKLDTNEIAAMFVFFQYWVGLATLPPA